MTPAQKIRYWYATLDENSLEELPLYYVTNAQFKDPFNEVVGISDIKQIFVHMFSTTVQPHFVFIDLIEKADQAFLTWYFHFKLNGREYTVKGASHLHFNAEGLIVNHRDYWDPAEELWQKLPFIGGIIAWLRSRFNSKLNAKK